MYRGWTQIEYQNKHYNINQKDEGTYDDRGRDGGTNFMLRIKEQEKRLTLQEHDDDHHHHHHHHQNREDFNLFNEPQPPSLRSLTYHTKQVRAYNVRRVIVYSWNNP